jgi:rSAM/selenodomain-associated transferase 2
MTKPLHLQPAVSVIIPVYHEPHLQAFIHSIAQQNYPETEIWVVDGDPQGSSIADLKSLSSQLPNLHLLISPAKGRAAQMNAGAQQAQGDILLFLHADTQLPPDALYHMVNKLRAEPQAVGGAFDLGIDHPRLIYRWIERISSWRSRCTGIPYGDQGLFFRRDAFLAWGGFPALPLMEDLALGRFLNRHQQPRIFMKQRVMTSPRRWETEGWAYTTLRNWTLASLFLLGVPVHALIRFYPHITRNKTDSA